MKNDTNDEKSDATPYDPPVIAPSSKDNPEMEVIVDNLTSRKSENDTEEGFIADKTPENDELDVNRLLQIIKLILHLYNCAS